MREIMHSRDAQCNTGGMTLIPCHGKYSDQHKWWDKHTAYDVHVWCSILAAYGRLAVIPLIVQ